MIYPVVSMYDSVSELWNAPSISTNNDTAMRSFIDLMKHEPFAGHQDEYDLYQVGTFDNETGIITPCSRKFLCCGDTSFLKIKEELGEKPYV